VWVISVVIGVICPTVWGHSECLFLLVVECCIVHWHVKWQLEPSVLCAQLVGMLHEAAFPAGKQGTADVCMTSVQVLLYPGTHLEGADAPATVARTGCGCL
jgi:hypothetical protein